MMRKKKKKNKVCRCRSDYGCGHSRLIKNKKKKGKKGKKEKKEKIPHVLTTPKRVVRM